MSDSIYGFFFLHNRVCVYRVKDVTFIKVKSMYYVEGEKWKTTSTRAHITTATASVAASIKMKTNEYSKRARKCNKLQ